MTHISVVDICSKPFENLGSVALLWQIHGPATQGAVARFVPGVRADDRLDLINERMGIIAFEHGRDQDLMDTAIDMARRQARGLPFDSSLNFIGPRHLVKEAARRLDLALGAEGMALSYSA